jgi:hypothetical protein
MASMRPAFTLHLRFKHTRSTCVDLYLNHRFTSFIGRAMFPQPDTPFFGIIAISTSISPRPSETPVVTSKRIVR